MAPKIVDKEAKKKEIIFAAMKVFSSKGITKAKMADIASEANIGKGTVYEYFRSKEEIFATAFNSMFADMEIRIREAIEITDDPLKKLQLLVDITLDYHVQDAGEFAGIMMDFWAEGVRTKNEEMIHIINLIHVYSEYRTMISTIINDGIRKDIFKKVDANSFAAMTIAMLDGIFLQIIMEPKIINIKKIKETITETLFSGLIKSQL